MSPCDAQFTCEFCSGGELARELGAAASPGPTRPDSGAPAGLTRMNSVLMLVVGV